jgi:hypothetical protein
MLIEEGRVPLHAELMCPKNMGHIIFVKELVDHARTKGVTSTS